MSSGNADGHSDVSIREASEFTQGQENREHARSGGFLRRTSKPQRLKKEPLRQEIRINGCQEKYMIINVLLRTQLTWQIKGVLSAGLVMRGFA
jgi:hypothetical protein